MVWESVFAAINFKNCKSICNSNSSLSTSTSKREHLVPAVQMYFDLANVKCFGFEKYLISNRWQSNNKKTTFIHTYKCQNSSLNCLFACLFSSKKRTPKSQHFVVQFVLFFQIFSVEILTAIFRFETITCIKPNLHHLLSKKTNKQSTHTAC